MSVTAQTPVISYTASGTATVFTYPFLILESTDLEVYLNGVESTTGFTVSGVGTPTGGSVTFTAAPPAGTLVKLQRNIPRTRTTDYVEGGALRADTLDADFDRIVMMLQDIEAGTPVEVENYTSEIAVETFTATQDQTLFTLTNSFTLGANLLQVSVNGAIQTPIVDYAETSSTSITFTTGLNAGDVVQCRIIKIYPGVVTTAALVGYDAGSNVEAALDDQASTLASHEATLDGHSDKLSDLVSVKDFGAVGDGVTDDAVAIRLALDAAASQTASGVGCTLFFPAGVYYCPSTVFIPKCNGPLRITGAGAVLKGAAAGTGTIFETGAQSYSTAGTSNWGLPEVHLHYNTVIDGLKFIDCEYALKVYNFLQGCVIKNCTSTSVKTLVYAARCFYLHVLYNSVMNSHDPAVTVDTDACFRFEDNNNSMVIQGNSALRSAITKGTGYYFASGTSAVNFTGNSAERCGKGIVIEGAVYSMSVTDNFLEGNTKDLCIEDGNYKDGLTVDGNWFYSAVAIEAVTWRSGVLGPGNRYEGSGSVTISSTLGSDGHLNSLHVWLPRTLNDESAHRTAAIVPTNWSLGASTIVHRQNSTYIAANGPGDPRHMLAEVALGPSGIVPRYYAGLSNLRRFATSQGGMPYQQITNNTNPGPGTIIIDCPNIPWHADEAGARFFFTVTDSVSTYRMCGWVMGTSVFRDDALPQTCTASINAGKLRLTIGNFTVGDVAGGVYLL